MGDEPYFPDLDYDIIIIDQNRLYEHRTRETLADYDIAYRSCIVYQLPSSN